MGGANGDGKDPRGDGEDRQVDVDDGAEGGTGSGTMDDIHLLSMVMMMILLMMMMTDISITNPYGPRRNRI